MIVDEELLTDFMEESKDIIKRVNDVMEVLSTQPLDQSQIEELFRSVHTIKGGAVMFGWKNTQEKSHVLESYLGECKKDLSRFDMDHVREAIDEIENLLENKDVQSNSALSADSNKEDEIAKQKEQIKHPEENKKTARGEVLRIPLKKVNDTLNSIWEIFLIRNQISYLFEKNKVFFKKNYEIFQEWEILDNSLKRNITELESTAMSMRMENMSSLYSRMAKVVREYKKNTAKDIELQAIGEEVELDKKVIDKLGEPLIHLVRNALDHGIEYPDKRKEKNKPTKGKIKLSAYSLSDKVVLKIEDDGKGINPQKIKEKALQMGLDLSHIHSDIDMIHLIFSSGFSTAEMITDVSGRGVGMDAVRKSIQNLGGEIFIDSQVGKGTIFTIELPLSLSVIDSILYEINGKTYASGINNIIEICREPESVVEVNNGTHYLPYRGSFIECYDLRKVFKQNKDSYSKMEKYASFCILSDNPTPVALRVNRVIKHTEIVVKEVKGIFPDLDYLSGVSILATGQPVFVLSLNNIFREIKTGWREHAA